MQNATFIDIDPMLKCHITNKVSINSEEVTGLRVDKISCTFYSPFLRLELGMVK